MKARSKLLTELGSLRTQGRMLVALAVTGFVLVGICATSVGLLLNPLMAEFHWKNAAVSSLPTVYSLAAMLSGPLAGVFIDRWGSKFVMLAGTLMVVGGYVALSYCTTLGEFYAAFLVIGVGYGGAFYLASSALIAAQMGERKHLSMGIWMLAGSCGAAVFSLGITWLIAAVGWRNTCLISALFVGLMLPMMQTLIPHHRAAGSVSDFPSSKFKAVPWPLLVAPAFLLMSAASAFAAFGMSAVYYHAVPILVKAGFSAETAGRILGASWVISGVGSLCLGAVSNRFGVANILKFSLFLNAVGTFALLVGAAGALGIVAAGLFVLLWGATANAINQFLPILIVERFGPVHLGVLAGVQGALMGMVGSFAPIVTGSLYDKYSNYAAAIVASVLATLVAVVLMFCLRREDIRDARAAGP